MVDLIGQTLGQYRITGRIGQGGMATVYKAYQPSLDRYVAVKVLPPYFAHEPGFAMRFTREARAVARLNHPNILPIYDFGQESDLSYIVMKCVEAGTLKDIMGQPLALDEAADILRQIAAALDHAHQRGILHRDVKPSNVLLDEGRWVLLTDFGLAKMVEGSAVLTASGVGVGTPAYMAPEQGQGEMVGARADIYSLGVVLYEMLTGRVPFEAETPMAVVIKHITEPLPLPRSLNPEMSDAVERVILKALAKNPDDRFATTVEMADALASAAAAVAPPAPETIEVPPLEPLPVPPPVSPPAALRTGPVEPTAPAPESAESVLMVEPLPAEPVPIPIPTPTPPAAEAPVPARKGIPWKIVGGLAGVIVLALAAIFVLSNLDRDGKEPTPTVAAAVTEKAATVTRPAPTATPRQEPTSTPKPTERPSRLGEELREVQFEKVYVEADFEKPGELEMDVPPGWQVGDDGSGNRVLVGKGDEFPFLLPGSSEWPAFVLEMRVMLVEGEEGNVIVRYDKDTGGGVRLVFAQDRWEFIPLPEGKEVDSYHGMNNLGEWHHLRVVVVENRLATFLDGDLMFDAELESLVGDVGFSVHKDSAIYVDDLRITGPPIGPQHAGWELYDDFDQGFLDEERWEWQPAVDGDVAAVDDRGFLIIEAKNPHPEPVYGELLARIDRPLVEVQVDLVVEGLEGEHTDLFINLFAEGRPMAGIIGENGSVAAFEEKEGLRFLLDGKGFPAKIHLHLVLTPEEAMHIVVDGKEVGAIPAPPMAEGFSIAYRLDPEGSLVGQVDNVEVRYAEKAGEIMLWHTYRLGAEEEILAQLIGRIQATIPGLTVHVERVPYGEIYDRYWEEASAGGGPDMLLAPNDRLGDMARSGLVLNLDPYLAGELDGISEMGLEGMKVDGKLYGVPESASAAVLYYNRSWIDTPPATTDELLEAVRGGTPMAYFVSAYHLFGWTSAFGGQLMDGSGRCIADQGGWVGALEYLLALQEAGAIFADYGAAHEAFRAGEMGFFVNGPWALNDYLDALGESLGVAPLPAGPDGPAKPLIGISGFYINPNSPNVRAAIKLALFLTGQEVSQVFTDKARSVPVRLDVAVENPLVATFVEAATTGFQRPQRAEFSNYWGPFDHMFREVLEGAVAPADGLAEACTAMNEASETSMSREPEPHPCEDELGCVDVLPGEPVHIAFILDLSGPARFLGIDSLRGVEIAVDYLSETRGYAIELTGEDSICNPEVSAEVASWIADDPSVVAVIGTSCSVAAATAAPIISEAGLVMVSPSTTRPLLTDPRMHQPGYLRVVPNDKFQARVVGALAREELGIQRAATLYEDNSYSKVMQNVFAETFKELGGEITIQAEVQPNEAQVHTTLASVARAEPELIFYPVPFELGGLVTRLARETPGLEEVILVAAGDMFVPELLEIAGPAAEGLYLSTFDLSAVSEFYQDFVGRYEEMYGEPPLSFSHAYAFDAVMMIFDAIERVAVQTDDGALHIGRGALREALFATRDFKGLTGVLTCSRYGDCANARAVVYQIVSSEPNSWEPGLNPIQVWP